MENQQIWSILGISPSKDENEIKEAYRRELVKYNPEDDAIGFKRLREAYEAAIVYANTEPEEKAKDEIDLWIDKADALYKNIYTRIDATKWKELFKDEVCVNLDTCDMAKEKFMVFLMDHYNFPQNIFKLFDEEFAIIQTREELLEKFPMDFLNYIEYQINNPQFINYNLFEVLCLDESEADIDGFINFLYDVRRLNEEKNPDAILRYEDYKKYEVMHPYLKVEKLNALDLQERYEEAQKIVDELSEIENDNYITYMLAYHYYICADYDKAMPMFRSLIESNPNHFGALLFECKNLLRIKQYTEAKQAILDLLEKYPRDQQLVDLMQEINEGLNIELKEKYDKSGVCKDAIEYAWCIFQNEKYDETIKLLDTLNPEEDEEIYDYYNLYGRCLFAMKEYAKAIPYATKWNELVLAAVDDGSEQYKKKERRRGFSFGMLAMCYTEIEQFEKAVEYYEKAIEIENNEVNNMSYRDALSDCYIRMKEYKKAIKVCDELIAMDKGYFPAYCHRQEAYFNLNYGQEVVEDYYNAIRIYNKYFKPYYLAARIYYNYEQYDNALAVIEEAKNNEIESLSLNFMELKVKRMLTDSNQERQELITKLQNLVYEARNDTSDFEAVHEILYEICLTYMDSCDYINALTYIDKTLELDNRYGYMWTRGDIFFNYEKYEAALNVYSEILKMDDKNPAIYFDLGKTFERLGRYDEALKEYKKSLELDPNRPNVNNRIMNIYNELYNDNNDPKNYKEAVKYSDRQIEVNPSCYYYVERGLLFADGSEHEKALEAFEKALEYDPNDLYAYNNMGYSYKILGKIDEAIEVLNKSVECMESTGNQSPYPHRNLAHCYEILGDFRKAREEFMINANMFPDNKRWLLEVGHEYIREGDYNNAIRIYNQIKEKFGSFGYNEDIEIGKAYTIAGQKLMAYKKLKIKGFFKSKKPTADELLKCGRAFMFNLRDYELAKDYLLSACLVAKGNKNFIIDCYHELAVVYKRLKQDKEAREYANKQLELIVEKYGSIERYLAFLQYAPVRKGIIGRMYLCLDRLDEAMKLFEEMGKDMRCVHCREKKCYETFLNKGLLYELTKEYKLAYEMYAKAVEIAPFDMEGVTGMEAMKGKL